MSEVTPTWQQAVDNIRAGEIRLKDNKPFTLTGFKYIQEKFVNTPAITLKVSCDVPNESVIEFKDGSLFGLEFLGPDTQYMYAVRLFIYFPEYEVIGHTTAGTPYTWASNNQCINWYEIHVPGQEQPWHYDITECAMSFAIFVDNDGQYVPEDYFMVYVLYPTEGYCADAPTSEAIWKQNYEYALYWETRGIFGYLEAQSHIVDWLCGAYSPPAEYPGDPSSTGGGSGYFYSQNDVIGIPDLPSTQAIDFGFSTIYNPSVAEIQQVARWLWSDDFDEQIERYWDKYEKRISAWYLAQKQPDDLIISASPACIIGPIAKRLLICIPLFAISIAMLVWQVENPDGFNTIWQYFGWSNQALSVFTLWTVTVYLVRHKKCFWVTLIPALFMTTVCSTYAFVSKQMLGMGDIGYIPGVACLVVACICFALWYRKENKTNE